MRRPVRTQHDSWKELARSYPILPPELLARLRDQFPEPKVTPEGSREQDLFRAGAASVVAFLEKIHKKQQQRE